MDGQVTISLKEYDKLKEKISKLEQEVENLQKIKEPRHFVQVRYDFSKGTDSWNNFGVELINEDDIKVEFEKIVKHSFETVLRYSPQNRFYKSFPKWIPKLFGF